MGALTYAEMSINASISCGAGQAPVRRLRYVLLSFGIPVLLGEPEIYQEHRLRLGGPQADTEVLRFQISVNVIFGM
jgi:hypothetical protein